MDAAENASAWNSDLRIWPHPSWQRFWIIWKPPVRKAARTRNLRLAAIHSFFRYAALEAPQHAGLIQRVLAIPRKRYSPALVDFLTRPEIEALLAVANRNTWECRYAIHDISRVKIDPNIGLPRFNMILELAIYLGVKMSTGPGTPSKSYNI
jgi:integrase